MGIARVYTAWSFPQRQLWTSAARAVMLLEKAEEQDGQIETAVGCGNRRADRGVVCAASSFAAIGTVAVCAMARHDVGSWMVGLGGWGRIAGVAGGDVSADAVWAVAKPKAGCRGGVGLRIRAFFKPS